MISAVKNVLKTVLVGIGIAEDKIVRDARGEQGLITKGVSLPFATLITDPGRFEAADHREIRLEVDGRIVYRQVRIRRVMPVVVKIVGENEPQAGSLISSFISALPFFWQYEGIEGDVEPIREEYSDYDSRMNPRYEAAAVVEFAVDVKSKDVNAEKIVGVDVGEGRYEEYQ